MDKSEKMKQVLNEIFEPVWPNLAKIFQSFTELNENNEIIQNSTEVNNGYR